MALSVCRPVNEMEGENSRLHPIHQVIEPPPIVAPKHCAEKQHRCKCGLRKKHKPDYWGPIIMRHAKDLSYLPVPPKDFVHRERKAMRSKDSEKRDRLQVSFSALLRGVRQRELPFQRGNECRRWVLLPMTKKPPEPMPGVPTITVTDPGGKTWWPKDPNSYIDSEQLRAITARATEQHHGPDSEVHCAAFQEAYRKGLDNKPMGMRPEVLYCRECWTKQVELEEDEARVANEVRITEEQPTSKVQEAIVEVTACVLKLIV